ncbi:DNA adenine methylase [Lignipirellula cremea]|uniref:DNA adenine methylase n=1 Tax=Lignipirellula cremea TaxID=2528010 RepID=A0A518DWF2_9BACT|nr:DNA adenine methylase [Lignipirellula cremea]QDU96159.1 DNA adenine methylase [Lignipirellula cremea]
MIAKKRLTPPLKWHGGKHYLAKTIIQKMPPHIHYVEAFFGGGSVLLQKDYENVSEVVNDVHSELTNFWKVLQDAEKFAVLQRRLEVTPFSQTEWKEAAEPTDDPIENAVRFFIRCRQSHAGRSTSFAPMSRTRTRRAMNEQASAWMGAVEGLAEVAQRLRRVVIFNDNALKVIRTEDGPHTLFYLDPPYLAETRANPQVYEFEMSLEEHEALLDTIVQCEGKVLLSGYPSELYDTRLKGWEKFDIEIDNKASNAKSKRVMTERLWMNYDPESV